MEKDLKELLEDVIDTLMGVGCTFWACEGPDVPYEDMRTCSVCQTVMNVREYMSSHKQKRVEGGNHKVD